MPRTCHGQHEYILSWVPVILVMSWKANALTSKCNFNNVRLAKFNQVNEWTIKSKSIVIYLNKVNERETPSEGHDHKARRRICEGSRLKCLDDALAQNVLHVVEKET